LPFVQLIVTSDLHYNHPRSKPLAEDLIAQINSTEADVLLVIGDTAAWDSDAFEQCLSRITFAGSKLLTAGNHELWSLHEDSYRIYTQLLPERTRRAGWHWLEDEPFLFESFAIVGSVGWYDFSFAQKELGIPTRFYEAKVSPGAAERLGGYAKLFERVDDIEPQAKEIIARWNDGRYVRLGKTDAEFLDELIAKLRSQLEALTDRTVIAAIHHLAFRQLLPPSRSPQWDFAKAYLGSEAIGDLLLDYPNVSQVFCGHSHFPAVAQIGHVHATATGCGYRSKSLKVVDLV
jgi:hypothetical protein